MIQLYDTEKSDEVKKKVVFSLSQTNKKRALQKLMAIAKADPSLQARKEAIFWLGQSGDPDAVKFLEEILKCGPRILHAGARSGSLLLNHDAHRVEGALICLIFARDPLRNGLHAFETVGRIKVRALLARVQFEATLGASRR